MNLSKEASPPIPSEPPIQYVRTIKEAILFVHGLRNYSVRIYSAEKPPEMQFVRDGSWKDVATVIAGQSADLLLYGKRRALIPERFIALVKRGRTPDAFEVEFHTKLRSKDFRQHLRQLFGPRIPRNWHFPTITSKNATGREQKNRFKLKTRKARAR